MHHEVSFLYHWVNSILESLLGPPPQRVLFEVGSFAFRTPEVWLPDHVLNAILVVLLILVGGLVLKSRLKKTSPSGFQQAIEVFVAAIRDLLLDVIGPHGRHYMPLLGSFAFFILVSNFFGLVFFLQPPTANLNTNLALALVSFVYYHTQGLRHSGLRYFKHFLGPIAAMFLLFLPLELVSHTARVVSLTLRLTGNISGEHAASGFFFGLFPLVVPWPMMLLGIIGAIMQTLIFVMLSTVYVAEAVAEEH